MEKMLPKEIGDFQSKDYWTNFFEQRGGLPFEWFGDYRNYAEILEKELKPENKIMLLGCGNSLIGERLWDNGYKKIVGIDYCEKVIKEMKERSHGRSIEYQVMDATDMKFEPQSFEAIIDKGTLDAVLVNEEPAAMEISEKIWENCCRVLASKGKYICITLLQQHILSKILSYFIHGNKNSAFAENAFIRLLYKRIIDFLISI